MSGNSDSDNTSRWGTAISADHRCTHRAAQVHYLEGQTQAFCLCVSSLASQSRCWSGELYVGRNLLDRFRGGRGRSGMENSWWTRSIRIEACQYVACTSELAGQVDADPSIVSAARNVNAPDSPARLPPVSSSVFAGRSCPRLDRKPI